MGTDTGQIDAINPDMVKPQISDSTDSFLRLFRHCPSATLQCLLNNVTPLGEGKSICLTTFTILGKTWSDWVAAS